MHLVRDSLCSAGIMQVLYCGFEGDYFVPLFCKKSPVRLENCEIVKSFQLCKAKVPIFVEPFLSSEP